MADITISLPDGSKRILPAGASGADLAADIGPGLAKAALIVSVDGIQRDLAGPLDDGASVAVITADSDAGLHTLRHSTAHVLAQAVLDLWPGATYAIGPPILNGFYYDFELPDGATFSADDLEAIDVRMREIIAADQPFDRFETNASDALGLFAGHRFKQEIIERVTAGEAGSEMAGEMAATAPQGGTAAGVISCYRNGDGFIDLCMGPHVPSTGRLGHFALQTVAGAYWRGDEGQPMLQRIYGTAWSSAKELKGHLHRLAEAWKHRHR